MKLLKAKGSSLLMVLIVLVALLFSAMAMIRSTEMSSMIAGNIAFKTATAAMGDVGIQLASTNLAAMGNVETASALYFPAQQTVDANGIPTSADWTTLPSTTVNNYTIQYMLERLCVAPFPVIDPVSQCQTFDMAGIGSKKSTAAVITTNNLYYRATVRIQGPRNTLSFIQAILERS